MALDLSTIDFAAEQFAYGMGNATVLIKEVSPVARISVTGLKMGARFGRTYKSYMNGGWYNPSFYANSLSTGFSGASFGLQCVSYGVSACPTIALPLYGLSQAFGATADIIDSTFGVATFF